MSHARLNKVFSLSKSSRGLAGKTNIGVDSHEVSATAVISTPAWDRQNDSVNPLGGNFDNYRLNPVVFWDHGLEMTLPIGKSDHAGELLVWPTKEGIKAKCLFSQKSKEAMQVFDLVDEEIIRAASIRFTPLDRPVRKSQGTYYDAWELEEWSLTGLGVNPKAVREVISKGRLNGEQIAPSIMKSLRAIAPAQSRSVFRGYSVEEEDGKHVNEYEGGNDEDVLEEPLPEDDMGMEKADTPYGASMMEEAYASYHGANEKLKQGMGTLEHPGVRELLGDVQMKTDEIVAGIAGGYGEHYPDREMPEMSDGVDDGSDEEATTLKSYIAANNLARFRTSRLANQLKSLSGETALPKRLRTMLKSTCSQLSKIIDESRDFDPVKARQQAELREIERQFAEVEARIKAAAPCRRRP